MAGTGSSLIIRRAEVSDKPAVVEFSSKIWEGWDYLPRVFDRWLKDPRGAFLVAELDGRPVGTDKITVLSLGEIWLEGLRVDPAVQKQGVALAINRKAMEIIAGLNPRTIRFATVADNLASRHMGEKDGFQLLFECRRMVAGEPDEKPNPEFVVETTVGLAAESNGEPAAESSAEQTVDSEPAARLSAGPGQEASPEPAVGPEDLDAVMDFLEGSENCRRTRGLYAWGWTFQEMSREFIAQVLAREGALAVRTGRRIEALALFLPQRHGPRMCLGFIDGGKEEMTPDGGGKGAVELARRFRAVAGEKHAEGAFAMVPERAVPVLSAAGFRQEYPIEVVVYELGGPRLEAALREVSGG
jgi:hypothetical protein